MYKLFRKNLFFAAVFTSIAVISLLSLSGCTEGPEWKAVNDQIISEHDVAMRELPFNTETGITSNLQDGTVTDVRSLPDTELAPGVTAKIYWGRGNLIALVSMEPNAEIPEETLSNERVMVMLGGDLQQLVNGQWETMKFEEPAPMFYMSTGYIGYRHCLYLEAGAQNAVKAGPNGASYIEFYAPVRTDYMQLTGATVPADITPAAMNGTPNFPPNQVFNFYDIQFTMLVPGAWARIINGKGMQISGITMWPGIEFAYHTHPEEQVMTTVKGLIHEYILDKTIDMTYNPDTGQRDVLFLPAQMVHGAMLSDIGCDAFDIFYPTRDDYTQKMEDRMAAYHSIIPEGEMPQLLAEGFTFTEGPVWLDGELYFSDMFLDIPSGTWQADVSKSNLIAMKPDGTWRYVLQGKMQTNGLMADGNGNIVACDMAGHRMVRLSKTGQVLDVLATSITGGDVQNGLRLDGPNDLVIDAKGGIYFTDPQFIFDEAMRPSKTVNYIRPDGEVICVIENVGNQEFQQPNGILLSPDGKTLYVDSTYHIPGMEGKTSEAENFVYAYDVNEDGTLSNKRRFGELLVPSTEFAIGSRTTTADGMTIDELGNVYVATDTGVQILSPTGEYIGNIFTPVAPVSVCFGGENFDELYIVGWDKVWSIKTKVKGLVYPLQSM